MLYSPEQLYIHICMQKDIQHNKDERTQFFRKIYLSLYSKGCVWEGVGDRTKTATYWSSQLFWLSQPFFPVLLGCSTRDLGAQPLLGHGSFECEIIKIGQSFHKMYNNNILNFQVSMTILNAYTKKVWKPIECTTYI